MHWEIPLLFYDSTNAYVTRQGNDHYDYHNATMSAAIPSGRPTSTGTKECSAGQKGTHEVCEPTSGSILTCVDFV